MHQWTQWIYNSVKFWDHKYLILGSSPCNFIPWITQSECLQWVLPWWRKGLSHTSLGHHITYLQSTITLQSSQIDLRLLERLNQGPLEYWAEDSILSMCCSNTEEFWFENSLVFLKISFTLSKKFPSHSNFNPWRC